jgi:hypothetical protein
MFRSTSKTGFLGLFFQRAALYAVQPHGYDYAGRSRDPAGGASQSPAYIYVCPTRPVPMADRAVFEQKVKKAEVKNGQKEHRLRTEEKATKSTAHN